MEPWMIGLGRMGMSPVRRPAPPDLFSARDVADFADKLLPATRFRFVGHAEGATIPTGGAL